MERVLLLDCNYLAVSIITWRKALLLLARNKADGLGLGVSKVIEGNKISVPSILRLNHPIPYNCFSNRIRFTKRNTFLRDHNKCQYCGVILTRSTSTIDHVFPKSRGGKTTYANCVACCKPCNNSKRNRTPEEAGITLSRKPKTPSFIVLCNGDPTIPKEWGVFLTGVYNEDRV
jgi:5-methylcytosine-specific restriction endonuclease McrA